MPHPVLRTILHKLYVYLPYRCLLLLISASCGTVTSRLPRLLVSGKLSFLIMDVPVDRHCGRTFIEKTCHPISAQQNWVLSRRVRRLRNFGLSTAFTGLRCMSYSKCARLCLSHIVYFSAMCWDRVDALATSHLRWIYCSYIVYHFFQLCRGIQRYSTP